MPSRRKGSSDRMRVRYQLGYDKSSPSICPTAFCNAFGITAYLRKRLKKEVKDGFFHMESNKQQFYENEPVGKDDLKEIKSLLKQCKVKLPKTLQVNMELPNTVGILKVEILIIYYIIIFISIRH